MLLVLTSNHSDDIKNVVKKGGDENMYLVTFTVVWHFPIITETQ